jgi:isopenicillin-N epimerase
LWQKKWAFLVAQTMYKSFGSFFSDSVPDLLTGKAVRCPRPVPLTEEKHWETLANEAKIVISTTDRSKRDEFALKLRELFMIEFEQVTFLNHGAFGSPLKFAFDEAQRWRIHCELDPLRFLDREMFSYWCDALDSLAGLLGLQNSLNLVLAPNATFGMWSVITSMISPGDEVLIFDLTYGSTKKMLAHRGARVRMAEVSLPIVSKQQIFEQISRAVTADTKIAIIDHITSNTALVLPVKEIVQELRAKGVLTVVDGAHSLVSIPDLNPEELQCDIYLGNCHKWLCVPRGVGFIWRKSADIQLQPAIASHGISEPDVQSRFLWIGNMDYSALLTLPSVIRFWKVFGFEYLAQHQKILLEYAVNSIKKAFGNEDVTILPSGDGLWDFAGPMILIKVPDSIVQKFVTAKALQDHFFAQHLEIPVKSLLQTLFMRLSIHLYNTFSDIDRLVQILQESAKLENKL